MDADKIRVKDLMKTDVKTVHKDVTLLTAIKIMRDFSVSSLIIEPESDGDAFGIITRKDVVEAIVINPVGGTSLLVDDVMTKPAITVNTGLSISNCHQMMRMVGVRRLPVVDGTKLIGILSNANIFVKLAEDLS
ncbi:MAG: CBS domain-containing protein [Desulfobacteraceae bacterium]|nr:CBS domain-containing protein [Desulfobacteraceae bacterium]MDH3573755.1 CBS domain-containing protein [Desulfobacteraceae bacterium]MDH3835773.1 CBS domain-containing protein [Desulfobacteraceae bacterium]MDH3873058.1 CBS domain-containing protein [Desulfobacteraceae bacterium]MDH3882465.1 CBS domain-containing protein [Desulfobacteraceae bacterium]